MSFYSQYVSRDRAWALAKSQTRYTYTTEFSYDIALCLSSVVCMECVVAKRKRCVLEQKLSLLLTLLTVCRKSYMKNRLVPK